LPAARDAPPDRPLDRADSRRIHRRRQ
jgi:hypothetical protein